MPYGQKTQTFISNKIIKFVEKINVEQKNSIYFKTQ